MVMGECKNWQRKYCIAQRNYKHTKGRCGKLPLGNVYKCHGILSSAHKFKKTNFKTSFHKFIVRFVNRRLGFPSQPPINKTYETQ
jgi:hypothetical protein